MTNKNTKFSTIIFDFDGTLVNTSPGIIRIFQETLKECGGSQPDHKQITAIIGLPLAQMMKIFLKTGSEESIQKASNCFTGKYSTQGIYENNLYPGIKDLLQELDKKNTMCMIVSNKPQVFIYKILKQHGIEKYFRYVEGTRLNSQKKKKSENITRILEERSLDKEKTVIVGDSESDIEAGKVNGIIAFAVSYGYRSSESLKRAGADKIFQSVEELKNYLLK